MAKRKKAPRLSRKESARRQKISKSLKAHYRRKEQTSRKISKSLKKHYRGKREARPNLIDMERFAFRLKDQGGDTLQEKIAANRGGDVTIRIETAGGDFIEKVHHIDYDDDDPEQFWRDYFQFVRDDIEDAEEETGYEYDEMGVTVTALK